MFTDSGWYTTAVSSGRYFQSKCLAFIMSRIGLWGTILFYFIRLLESYLMQQIVYMDFVELWALLQSNTVCLAVYFLISLTLSHLLENGFVFNIDETLYYDLSWPTSYFKHVQVNKPPPLPSKWESINKVIPLTICRKKMTSQCLRYTLFSEHGLLNTVVVVAFL